MLRSLPRLSTASTSSQPAYLVLGAGSAGSVITHRLREAGESVVLVDAGGWGNQGVEKTGIKVRDATYRTLWSLLVLQHRLAL